MLINPDKMVLIYKGVKFDLFEFERGWGKSIQSSVFFFAPICSHCLSMNRLTEENRQNISESDNGGVRCGVSECTNKADFFLEFNFGFEESDVEEIQEEGVDSMEDLYDSELNFE